MKKILFSLVALLLLYSCNNEIDVNASSKDLTVMYGLLDPALDSNYIRVQRGYLGDAPAAQSTDKPDSLYYDTSRIEVYIREINADNGQVLREQPLIYDTSVAKEPGTFTTQGHYLFRVPDNFGLDEDRLYEVATVRNDGTEAKGRTGIVGDIRIRVPVEPQSIRVFNGQIKFDISQGSARMVAFQPIIFFHYRELNLVTGDSTFQTEQIRLPVQNRSTSSIEILYESRELMAALSGRVGPADPNIIRFFRGMDIEIWGAAEDLVTYYQLNEPSGSINQNRPDFNQITNGTGLISSRTSARREDIRLEPSRVERDLQYSNFTCDLQFAKVERGRDTCFCRNGEKFCL